jgi:hypothetical protein
LNWPVFWLFLKKFAQQPLADGLNFFLHDNSNLGLLFSK